MCFPHARYTNQLRALLTARTKGSVITIMDKSSATPMLVCGQWYVQQVLVGLQVSGFYVESSDAAM